MKHAVTFENVQNRWDNALPLGNGVFGCMAYFSDNTLNLPMNHYEVYYNISDTVLPKDMLEDFPYSDKPGYEHIYRKSVADHNQPEDGETFCYYRVEKGKGLNNPCNAPDTFSGSYPQTGDLKLHFADHLADARSKLTLWTEDATCQLTLEKEGKSVDVETIVARQDCVISRIKQSEKGLLKTVAVDFPLCRDADAPDVTYNQVDEKTFTYTVRRVLPGKKEKLFTFAGVLRLIGATGKLTEEDGYTEIVLQDAEETFHLLVGVFTDWQYADPEAEGLRKMAEFASNLDGLYAQHKGYWQDFFARSAVHLPDKFLEQVYYENQYALDCCSGKDGIMKHHACGLNGLWDIKHPNLWGSMWYWDVNIQAAFAGVFSSNRTDLGKVFSDGLQTYVELAETFAKDVHGMTGISADYPYHFYYCVWPWCAQYLWYQYEYTMDKEYLRNEAYPLFLKIAEFLTQLFQYDEQRDCYSVYPDISPEQGPLAHNSMITVACAKYLFRFTLEAAQILGDDAPILDKCREYLQKMPEYATCKSSIYGEYFKDSPDAEDNMWIRHPGLLMPLFPVGEYDLTTDKEICDIFSNTVDYLEDRCEIGIFGGSWLAAAAARLGRGQTALRLLYERGIDHMLRSNGLTAEETERFMNFCLICRQPLYYPCMMEFTGEMLAAVNEMLLQSQNGLIRVFPAMPDGSVEYKKAVRHGYSVSEFDDRFANYPAWKTVSFEKLLAKGAFEVSASLKDGNLEWVKVHSKVGGKVRLTSPFMTKEYRVFCNGHQITFALDDSILSWDTRAGETYVISLAAEIVEPLPEQDYNSGILSHETYTQRHIYVGGDSESEYQKAVDSFIRSWYLGNVRMDNHTVYKIDFTNDGQKVYQPTLKKQNYGAEEMLLYTRNYLTVGEDKLPFTPKRGYGFAFDKGISIVDRDKPDCLRQDFAEGNAPVEFWIELPRGQYELLVCSGDAEEDSVTILETDNGWHTGGNIIPKGRYQCELIPLIHQKDGVLRIKISTIPGKRWKLNYIFLNAIKGY